MNRRGLTLIELLSTLTIVAILAQVAIPAMSAMKRRADAARVVGDLNAIRVAAFDHYAGLGYFPATQPWATPPATMINSLPQGFSWTYKSVQYRWHRFPLPGGVPGNQAQSALIAVEVQSADLALMAAIKGAYRAGTAFGTATNVTFILNN